MIGDFKSPRNEPSLLMKIASSKLHSAVFNGELTKVRLLVEVFRCSPLTFNRDGHTALHTAASCGDLAMLKYFIEDKLVNASIETSSQETPLHFAALNGHLSVIMYLVESQMVDPLILDGQLVSPLHNGFMSGNLSTVQYLLHECQQNQLLDVSDKTSSGRTLIHYAAQSGSPKVIAFLLTHSCNDKLTVGNESINSKDKVRMYVRALVTQQKEFAC